MVYIYSTVEERLKNYIDKSGDCWIWTSHLNTMGYGMITNDYGKQVRAHRFIYERNNGRIKKGLCVLHKCDNRACVNPEHLFVGTKKDNMQDCIKKNRHKYIAHYGEANGMSKLSKADVIKIRHMWAKGGIYQIDIARKFGVTQQVISKVVNYKTWVL